MDHGFCHSRGFEPERCKLVPQMLGPEFSPVDPMLKVCHGFGPTVVQNGYFVVEHIFSGGVDDFPQQVAQALDIIFDLFGDILEA